MTSDTPEGLDYAFLRWLPVVAEDQKRMHRFYLPFFSGCHTIVDLGCGEGNFVELLNEHGFEATGVDSDRVCCQAGQARGLNIIQQDALDYLHALPENSIDGFFAAHLVEHLPYQTVLQLTREMYRTLRPGGVVLLTTPNVRALVSHLEMYWLHFGHVAFYHPRLLGFFLELAGFPKWEMGENPSSPAPYLGDLLADISRPSDQKASTGDAFARALKPVQVPRRGARTGLNPLHRLVRAVRMLGVRLLVYPETDWMLDRLETEINARLEAMHITLNELEGHNHLRFTQIARAFERLDRPFEAYVVARKPSSSVPSTKTSEVLETSEALTSRPP